MRSFLRREDLFFICIFSIVGALLIFVSYQIYHIQFTKAYDQLSYFQNADFEYVFKTDDRLPNNSYLDIKNTKSFYLDEELTSRLQINILMQLDVIYDEAALLTREHLFTDTEIILGEFEIFITIETSNFYNLDIGDIIYSKSKIDQQIYPHTIKGIIANVYSSDNYEYSEQKGLLFIGYNTDEEMYSDSNYINYSLIDPSQTILENEVNLLMLYNRIDLIKLPKNQTVGFIALQTLITIVVSIGTYVIVINDLHSHGSRLKRIGANRTLTKVILTRAFLYLLFSFVTLVLSSILIFLINNQVIQTVILATIIITMTLVILCSSVIARYSH